MIKHGYSRRGKVHSLYKIWGDMINRCHNQNNKSYLNYGGRGISVCVEWRNSPVAFIEWAKNSGWRKGLSLDRRNNDDSYQPKNCRFVSHSISCINQRKRKDNTSGLRGVHFHKGKKKNRTRDKWDATVQYEKRRTHIGSFDDPIIAAIARDNFIKENDLPHKLNFKDTGATD